MSGRTNRQVHVDALTEGLARYEDHALVFVDPLLASTTLVTSCAQGRRTWLASTAEEGRRRAWSLPRPILAGEPGLALGPDIDSGTGPARLIAMPETERPLVFVCPWASPLPALRPAVTFVACLRNITATVEALRPFDRVAVVGAGFGGSTRCEDQMVAAWIAGRLLGHGYHAGSLRTSREIARWSRADVSVMALGRGADHLRRMGHDEDLDFVLRRIDDLDVACLWTGSEVRVAWHAPVRGTATAAH